MRCKFAPGAATSSLQCPRVCLDLNLTVNSTREREACVHQSPTNSRCSARRPRRSLYRAPRTQSSGPNPIAHSRLWLRGDSSCSTIEQPACEDAVELPTVGHSPAFSTVLLHGTADGASASGSSQDGISGSKQSMAATEESQNGQHQEPVPAQGEQATEASAGLLEQKTSRCRCKERCSELMKVCSLFAVLNAS